MAIVNPSDPQGQFHGKLGGIVYSQQPDGTVTARGAGQRTAEFTEGEKKGQRRMKLARLYVRSVLDDPAQKSIYAAEANLRKKRTCDLVNSDFLTDPVITSVDVTEYHGLTGGWVLIVTGDDFKVIRARVDLRDAAGKRVEEGFAVRSHAGSARVWVYTAQQDLAAGQTLSIEVQVTDRPGHSATVIVPHPV